MMVFDLDKTFEDSRICLLGNLYFARGTSCIQRRAGTKSVHKYFKGGGIDVVSIDLNGKDGALPLDLQEPLPESIGKFDIIINAGTSEHVREHEKCFENVNNICRPGGLMFHIVPEVGSWPKHGLHHYTESFFKDLAKKYHYSVVDMRVDDYVGPRNKLIFSCLRKDYHG
jgi:SAM-dependent methyltransferase